MHTGQPLRESLETGSVEMIGNPNSPLAKFAAGVFDNANFIQTTGMKPGDNVAGLLGGGDVVGNPNSDLTKMVLTGALVIGGTAALLKIVTDEVKNDGADQRKVKSNFTLG